MAQRTCGWCGSNIEHLRSNAQYCSRQHKQNAGSQRHRERNPGYYARYRSAPSRVVYRETNRDLLRAKARARRVGWSDERRQRESERNRQWWIENPSFHRIYQANRRFRQAAGPGVSERDWQRLLRRYDDRCAYCGTRPDVIHMDHVVPLKRGGQHSIGNVLPACPDCNLRKSARLLAAWKRGR